MSFEIPSELLGLLNEGRIVPFIGAGCSIEPDSNLPSASELAEWLIARGHGQSGDTLEDIAERLVSSGGWQRLAAAIPRAEWRAAPCNECHVVLAELCREGLIRRILTTNWDTLVEAALHDVGLEYAPIVHADALATEPPDTLAIIKLHGCIEHPQYLKATRSQMESTDWADDWARALFETIVRSHSIGFVGYSGSARAATHTVAKIVRAGERNATDFLVDTRGYEELQADEVTGPFLDAIGLGPERALQSGASAFFLRLREEIYPLLLQRPLEEARSLIDALCSPTAISPTDIHEGLNQLHRWWEGEGPSAAQEWLGAAFLSFPECRARHSYVSIVQRKTEIGRFWAGIAVAVWASVIQFSGEVLELLAEATMAGATKRFTCLMAVSPSSNRRDAVAHQLTNSIVTKASASAPITARIGILYGGMGPSPDVTRDLSVARGPRRASVTRPGSVVVAWMDGDQLFEFFEPGAEASHVMGEVRSLFTEVGSRLNRMLEER